MADSRRIDRRTGGSLSWRRNRKRWTIGGCVGAAWLGYAIASGSLIGSTALLIALGTLGLVVTLILRSLGFGLDHPLLRPLATRPWRDGQDVFQLALRNLRQAFIISPTGSLIAPNAIELCMNPADLRSLAESIDPELVNLLAAEAYEAAVTAYSARTFRHAPLEVAVIADPQTQQGRYRIRQRQHADGSASAGAPAMAAAHATAGADGNANAFGRAQTLGRTAMTLAPTKTLPTGTADQDQPQNPLLRLVTEGSVTQTRMSGARAGRAGTAELLLPDELTVSRLHARFRCAGGRWLITPLGRNGVVVNGTELTGERQLGDGDVIRWGRQADALTSRVEIR